MALSLCTVAALRCPGIAALWSRANKFIVTAIRRRRPRRVRERQINHI